MIVDDEYMIVKVRTPIRREERLQTCRDCVANVKPWIVVITDVNMPTVTD